MRVYIGKKEMETLVNSFVFSNFNYCFLVWHFTTCKSTNKIEKMHQRCLRILLYDSKSDYKTLLEKSGKCSMETKQLRVLSIEMFKTVNNLNTTLMKDISTSKINVFIVL